MTRLMSRDEIGDLSTIAKGHYIGCCSFAGEHITSMERVVRYVTIVVTQSNLLRDTQRAHPCARTRVHACVYVRMVTARAKGHDHARFFSLESPRPARIAIL